MKIIPFYYEALHDFTVWKMKRIIDQEVFSQEILCDFTWFTSFIVILRKETEKFRKVWK